jgi:hypothetical protein
MARYRTIKPEFWTSEQVIECSANARLLFIGLWNFCDDAGRHPYKPKQIKAEIFPGDDISVETILGLLQELIRHKLLRLYRVEAEQFLLVTGWHHQRIDKPQRPKYPAPIDDASESVPGIVQPEGNREEGNRIEGKRVSVPSEPHPAKAGMPPDLRHAIEAYNTVAADVGLPLCRALNASRRTKLVARLKESGLAGWCSAVANLRDSPFLLGQNNRGWKADFDFLLQPKSFGKLLDGAYRYTKPRSAGMQAVLDYANEVENEGFGGQELRVEGGGDAGRFLPEPSR